MQAIKVLIIAEKNPKTNVNGNVFWLQYASYLHTNMKHQLIIFLFKYLHISQLNHP